MISIRKLTKDNWNEVLALSIHPDQTRFVKDPTYCIAKAYIMPDGLCVVPFTIYLDTTLIGFFSLEFSKTNYWIDGIRIDKAWQNKGFGTEALFSICDMLKETYPLCKTIGIRVHPSNTIGLKWAKGFGFKEVEAPYEDALAFSYKLRPIRRKKISSR